MFLPQYGFRESPFGVTPDPRYLYATETHREALASLLYGINSGLGFMTLTALPGMGKTTLLFEVLGTLQNKATTAFIFQPVSAPVDLLRLILSEIGVSSPPGGTIELQMQLNEWLIKNFEAGKRFVLAIDEAQNMNDAVLEQVRMLSNFETSREKLMQIILAGQPQLAARLASPELLQLRQRISIAAHLEPLSQSDTVAYISHRLITAGYHNHLPLFNPSALEMIARYSEGIPRNINNICFNALALGCALKQGTVGVDIVREVIADLDLTQRVQAGATKTAGTVRATDSPRQFPLSILEADLVEPKRRTWLQNTIPLLAAAAIVIVFGIGYVRLLKPDRGSFPFGSLAKVASQRTPTTDAVDPEPAQIRAASDPANGASNPTANAVDPAPSETPEDSDATPNTASDTAVNRPDVRPMRSLKVHRGQSLYTVCARVFRGCNSEEFRALLDANPGVSNPNYLIPGQQIFVPGPPPSSRGQTKR